MGSGYYTPSKVRVYKNFSKYYNYLAKEFAQGLKR